MDVVGCIATSIINAQTWPAVLDKPYTNKKVSNALQATFLRKAPAAAERRHLGKDVQYKSV